MNQFPHKASRLKTIDPFYVMDILARARALELQGRNIIHLEVGEPDFPTADAIIRAGKNALDDRRTYYTGAMGLTELRQKIAEYYQRQLNVDIPYQRIVVTPGASGALQLALAVLIDRDSEVLLTDPGYPCNRHLVRLLEGNPVSVRVTDKDNFQLNAVHIQQYWNEKTVAAMVASPSNPTGSLLAREPLLNIVEAIRARGGQLIVDEIYQGLIYGQDNFTALSLSDDIFVINSFSKYFGMTGWRLGWMVVPEAYVNDVDKLAQNLFLAPATLSQYAALTAFSDESIAVFEQRRLVFKSRRDYLLAELINMGFGITSPPAGAFYIYADVSRFSGDSFKFVVDLLEQTGVAITPGKDFGQYKAERFVRFAYTQSIEVLRDAVQRMKKFL